MKVAFEEG